MNENNKDKGYGLKNGKSKLSKTNVKGITMTNGRKKSRIKRENTRFPEKHHSIPLNDGGVNKGFYALRIKNLRTLIMLETGLVLV